MPTPADLAKFDQLKAAGDKHLNAIVARVRLALSVKPEHTVIAELTRELDRDAEVASALAAVAVLRLAKES